MTRLILPILTMIESKSRWEELMDGKVNIANRLMGVIGKLMEVMGRSFMACNKHIIKSDFYKNTPMIMKYSSPLIIFFPKQSKIFLLN